jgi:uncharacterized protein
MRVAVSGATGLIGSALVEKLTERGDTVAALTRDTARARQKLPPGVELHEWRDPETSPPPAAALEGADAVVHLLGEPIAQRWSTAAKARIRDSRVLTTQQLVAAIRALPSNVRPAALISSSAAGYYGPHGEERVDETAAPGNDFLAEVTAEWEHAAKAAPPDTRVVCARTGLVLAPHGGALARMLPPFKLGVGGPVGGGRQFVPWIHLEDQVAAFMFLLDDERAVGPVNLTAPTPVTNRDLSHALGRALHRPAVVPVPALALKLLYGDMATIVLTGVRAVPARLLELGYEFAYGDIDTALADVLSR